MAGSVSGASDLRLGLDLGLGLSLGCPLVGVAAWGALKGVFFPVRARIAIRV